jgi:hypothetical protein
MLEEECCDIHACICMGTHIIYLTANLTFCIWLLGKLAQAVQCCTAWEWQGVMAVPSFCIASVCTGTIKRNVSRSHAKILEALEQSKSQMKKLVCKNNDDICMLILHLLFIILLFAKVS